MPKRVLAAGLALLALSVAACSSSSPETIRGCVIEPGTKCVDADLSYTNPSYTNLRKADLSDADLSYTNLRRANLTDANLTDADLSYTNLSDADLTAANLTGADLYAANLRGANLTGTKGLP